MWSQKGLARDWVHSDSDDDDDDEIGEEEGEEMNKKIVITYGIPK